MTIMTYKEPLNNISQTNFYNFGAGNYSQKRDWMVQQLSDYNGLLCSALRGHSAQVNPQTIIWEAVEHMMETACTFGMNREQVEDLLYDTYETLHPGTSSRVNEWMVNELTRKANADIPGFINHLNSALRDHAMQIPAIQIIEEYITQKVGSIDGQKYHLGHDTLFTLLLKTFDRLYPGERRVYLETHALPLCTVETINPLENIQTDRQLLDYYFPRA